MCSKSDWFTKQVLGQSEPLRSPVPNTHTHTKRDRETERETNGQTESPHRQKVLF